MLSIDVGGTYIKTALILNTQITNRNEYLTPENYQEFKRFINETITDYLKIDNFNRVGVSVPGSVDESGTIHHGGMVPYLNGVNLRKKIEEKFSVNVVIENDAKSAVLGESKYGNLKKVTNGVALILGTGVGVGIYLNGKVYKGSNNQAGEVSFLIQDRAISGPTSFVGINLSATNLVKKLSGILNIKNDGKLVFNELNKTTNDIAEKEFKEYCKGIAILCFNLQCILDIEKIVIGGGISHQAKLIEEINKEYNLLFKKSPIIEKTIQGITIQETKYKSDSNLIGLTEVSSYD